MRREHRARPLDGEPLAVTTADDGIIRNELYTDAEMHCDCARRLQALHRGEALAGSGVRRELRLRADHRHAVATADEIIGDVHASPISTPNDDVRNGWSALRAKPVPH